MNAIKFTPDGGRIAIEGKTIKESSGSPEVEITIHDTGIGIAKENQEVVFEKFYQTGEVLMHSSGKTKFKGGGPGLGLAIARGIVEAHGGRIWLKSPGYDEKTNPGTTVYVRLPVNGQKV
jgi:signal transduction histidine kinase